ncbi:hypothetical protein LTR37_016805 [Vermiconidia calcicola]|uniref:Uncharacterized protein n=1 Tax=Vermiconidia calcicola TaxID=1690605 RepID=A0ACC3MNG3_9PEZI|nr:hypothetical protein LTR37_016805 [Vermiconidia calcicola]
MSTCAKCEKPLVVEIDADEDEDVAMDASSPANTHTETIPDDVHLRCGCHFHWECLLDAYELATCPSCSREIVSLPTPGSSSSTAEQRLLVDLNNEGGSQQQIDIFPILKEESYLRAYPEERKCRAFLEFCREGDSRAITDLIKSCFDQPDDDNADVEADDVDGESNVPDKRPDEVLRYQDPIGGMESGLHAAAANGHREVAWLLLLLASQLPELDIPAFVYQEASALGVMRGDQKGRVDIRSLQDANGRSAEDVAKDTGVVWTGWIGNGRLAMP